MDGLSLLFYGYFRQLVFQSVMHLWHQGYRFWNNKTKMSRNCLWQYQDFKYYSTIHIFSRLASVLSLSKENCKICWIFFTHALTILSQAIRKLSEKIGKILHFFSLELTFLNQLAFATHKISDLVWLVFFTILETYGICNVKVSETDS